MAGLYEYMKLFFLLLMTTTLIIGVCSGAEGFLEVTSDIPGASVYFDEIFLGTTPLNVLDLEEGSHNVRAEIDGYEPLTKTIFINGGSGERVRFEFIPDSPDKIPGIIKIMDCVGTPERSGLSGSSINLFTRKDDSVEACFCEQGKGIRCAIEQEDGSWEILSDSILNSEENRDSALPPSGPWIYSVDTGYRMIYQTYSESGGKLATAFSEDGVSFTPEGDVVFLNEEFDPEDLYPSMPSGLKLPNNSLQMFYTEMKDGQDGILSAISEDGGKSWKTVEDFFLPKASDPSVLALPDGSVVLFYTDLTKNHKGQRVWFMHADDAEGFIDTDPSLVLEVGEPGLWILDPEIYLTPDGKYLLYFSVFNSHAKKNWVSEPVIMKAVIDMDCLSSQVSTE